MLRPALQVLPTELHFAEGASNTALVLEMGHETAQIFDGLRQPVANAVNQLDVVEGRRRLFQIALEMWKARREAFRSRYEDAKQRSSAHEATLPELAELEARVKVLRDRITATKALLAAVGDP